jgi:hypothetical protein
MGGSEPRAAAHMVPNLVEELLVTNGRYAFFQLWARQDAFST